MKNDSIMLNRHLVLLDGKTNKASYVGKVVEVCMETFDARIFTAIKESICFVALNAIEGRSLFFETENKARAAVDKHNDYTDTKNDPAYKNVAPFPVPKIKDDGDDDIVA